MSSSDLAGALVRRAVPVARRLRRAALIRRIAVLASAVGSTVDVDIALDAVIGRGIRIDVAPGTHTTVTIGAGTLVGDDVELQLRGGTLEVGPWCDLRRGVSLKVAGRLVMGERTTVGEGSRLHCGHEVVLGERVGLAEYVTVVDSSHRHTELGRPAHHDTVPGAVVVGDDCFVGSKATLTRSCRLGAFCIVGAGSVVVGEVADKTFVSGVPARVVSEVDLPWE